jgi:hypothetical protein
LRLLFGSLICAQNYNFYSISEKNFIRNRNFLVDERSSYQSDNYFIRLCLNGEIF